MLALGRLICNLSHYLKPFKSETYNQINVNIVKKSTSPACWKKQNVNRYFSSILNNFTKENDKMR